MSIDPSASLLALGEQRPIVDDTAFVAAGARIVGDVRLGPGASVWYNAVLRGDGAGITIGARSNVQDNVSVHVERNAPATIGDDVSIGHNAVVHGCTIGDGCLIGMGAVVLSRADIGAGSLVAGGAVVLERTVVPPGSLVAGVPATVRRALSDAERERLRSNAAGYLEHAERHASAVSG